MTRGYEIWRVLTNTHPGGGGPRTGESARTPSAVDMLRKYVKRMNGVDNAPDLGSLCLGQSF